MSATQTQHCHHCGVRLPVAAKFCVKCGTSTSAVFSDSGDGGATDQGRQPEDPLFAILQRETLGEYDLYSELGRGGMAAVFLALDLALDRQVAIKTMLPAMVFHDGMVQRFKREAQTAAKLNHPHIVQIYSVKEHEELVYFVMKYVEGRSLESVINERGTLDVDLTRVILSQAGSALTFANRKGVIHRDVKPANIMLEEDGGVVLTDFGIAKVQEAQSLTATGTAIGTPHYMSPEQFHNQVVTGASDQYSLGIVAFEMLTGKKPFNGATYAEIITQHLFDPPPDISALRPDVPAPVRDAIARMLAKAPADRFPDIDAAIAAMGAPTQTQGDHARTRMNSIARSGPEQKARMSVPISPVPTGKALRATADAATPPGGQAMAAPGAVPAVRSAQASRVGRWIGITAAIVVVAGAGAVFGSPITHWVRGDQATDTGGAKASPGSKVSVPSTAIAGQAPGLGHANDTSAVTPAGAPAIPPVTPRQQGSTSASGASGSKSAGDRGPSADVHPTRTGYIRLASKVDGAQLFIDNVRSKEPFTGQPANFKAPAGARVAIHITARNCAPYDTIVAVVADSVTSVGRRGPGC